MPATQFAITTEFIELNQLLKLVGLADSGGAGGALVTEGNVTVDGQPELRKRCKVRPGQVVKLGDVEVSVVLADAEAIAAARIKAPKQIKPGNAPWAPGGIRTPKQQKAKPKAKPQPQAVSARTAPQPAAPGSRGPRPAGGSAGGQARQNVKRRARGA